MALARTVTRLEKRGRRVRVFLDGAYAFSLSPLVLGRTGLHCDRCLTDHEIEELKAEDIFQRALDAALNYLSYRPRTESELRRRLAGREVPKEVMEAVMGRVRELGLLDDAAFARLWVQDRERLSPRGTLALRHELRRKGVSAELVEEVVGQEADEEASAYAVRAGLADG